jgi:hypothetical protein
MQPLHRLSDKLLAAFDQACEQNDLEVAGHLHRCLELLVLKLPAAGEGADAGAARPELEAAVQASARLAALRRR